MQGKERFRSLFSRNKSSSGQRRLFTDEDMRKGSLPNNSVIASHYKDFNNDNNSQYYTNRNDSISNEKPRY